MANRYVEKVKEPPAKSAEERAERQRKKVADSIGVGGVVCNECGAVVSAFDVRSGSAACITGGARGAATKLVICAKCLRKGR